MTAPKRRLDATDLLHGDDHAFVVNLYLAVLRRWPDEAGYRHFLDQVANRPERRVDAVREMAGSEEARRAGALVTIGEAPLPGDPNRARDTMLEVRTEVLGSDIARLRDAVALLSGVGGAEVAALQRELAEAQEAALRSEINAVRREMRAALANGTPAPAAPETPLAELALGLARLIDSLVSDRLGQLEARLEDRLRQIEARLPSPPP